MIIGKHNIPQQVVQDYLYAVKWNQSHATEESDRGQVDAHNDVLEAAGFGRNNLTDEAVTFSAALDTLVCDLLMKGYQNMGNKNMSHATMSRAEPDRIVKDDSAERFMEAFFDCYAKFSGIAMKAGVTDRGDRLALFAIYASRRE